MFQSKGIIKAILPEVYGTSSRGEWHKQDFVIEESVDQYPKLICFTLFNDKNDVFSRAGIGSEVNVSFNIESREYNEKYFTNLTAFKVEVIGQPREPEHFDSRTPVSDSDEKDDLPF